MVGRERGVVALLDLLAQGKKVHLVPVERALQGSHLQGERRGSVSAVLLLTLSPRTGGEQLAFKWDVLLTDCCLEACLLTLLNSKGSSGLSPRPILFLV